MRVVSSLKYEGSMQMFSNTKFQSINTSVIITSIRFIYDLLHFNIKLHLHKRKRKQHEYVAYVFVYCYFDRQGT